MYGALNKPAVNYGAYITAPSRYLAACILFLLQVCTCAAQTDTAGIKRLDSIESRLNRIEQELEKYPLPPRSQTRSATEGGRNEGLVITDNKRMVLRIGGFIQADAIHDFHGTGSPLGFLSSAIAIPNDKKSNTAYSVAASRFNLNGQMPAGRHTLKTLFEFDLYNESYTPALRHAWAEYAQVGMGMYWSNFMDVDAYPNTLDYNGPNAMIFGRQVQFRLSLPLTASSGAVLALEDPVSYVSSADTGFRSLRQLPDLTASVQHHGGGSHVRLGGVLHPVVAEDALKQKTRAWGYGFSLSTVLQQLRSKDNFVFQASYGRGIAKYFNDIGPDNYDAVWDEKERKLHTLPVWGLSCSYDHWWNNKLSSTAGWGYLQLTNNELQPGTAFKSSNYGIANIIFYPDSFIKGGVEFLYGTRKNKNTDQENNSRIQLTFQFQF